MERLNPLSTIQLSYFDECSTFNLQHYNIHILDKTNGKTNITEEWLLHEMEAEWKAKIDEYPHWEYVINPVPLQPKGKDQGHEGWTLDDFVYSSNSVNALLSPSEVIALRLYTGDGYKAINGSCRAANGDFAVTVFCANRGIAKLGKANKEQSPLLFYRGLRGRTRIAFSEAYASGDGLVECFSISDSGLFSTTSNISIATEGPFSGNLVFVISKEDQKNEGKVDNMGFEMVCTPAPVSFLSQYPHEDEYLWPTYISLVPKPPTQRKGITIPGKEVYEFVPTYFWDTQNKCVGRWRDIKGDDIEMSRVCMKLASKGLSMRDAFMAIPMLLVDGEIEEDLTVEQAVSVSFSVFDKEGVGVVQIEIVKELVYFFYLEIQDRDKKEVDGLWEKIYEELHPLESNGIRYSAFKKYFCAKEYIKT